MHIESAKWAYAIRNLAQARTIPGVGQGPVPDPWTPTLDPRPVPWKIVAVTRSTLVAASTLTQLANLLQDQDAKAQAIAAAVTKITEYDEYYCGNVPRPVPPITWPPIGDDGGDPRKIDYLIAASELQNFSATLDEGELKQAVDKTAAHCLEIGMSEIR